MIYKTSLIFIIIMLLISTNCLASADIGINKDNGQNFMVGALTYSLIDYSNTDITPMAGVFVVGLGKEVFDHYNNGTVEKEDFNATILGGLSMKLIKKTF